MFKCTTNMYVGMSYLEYITVYVLCGFIFTSTIILFSNYIELQDSRFEE